MKRLQEWGGVIALAVALVTLAGVGVSLGQRDQKITELETNKVDKAALEQRLGRMEGDLRVIRAVLCAEKPGACQ